MGRQREDCGCIEIVLRQRLLGVSEGVELLKDGGHPLEVGLDVVSLMSGHEQLAHPIHDPP